MDALILRETTPDDPATAALIQTHFQLMRSTSPEESCHVLPADGLRGTFMLAAEREGACIAIGALAVIAPEHGEIKSMHTAASARGTGAARAILQGLLAEAKQQNMTRVSLETGSFDAFAPARALYASAGFEDCAPFGDYVQDPLSVFMTRAI